MSNYLLKNPDTENAVVITDIDLTVDASGQVDPIVDKPLAALRASDDLLNAISTETLILWDNGTQLRPPQAITSLWGAFILRNDGVSTVHIEDLGLSVEPGNKYHMSLQPDYKMRNSKDLAVAIGSGALIASDGVDDMSATKAIKHIFGIKGIGADDVARIVEITDLNSNIGLYYVLQDHYRLKWLTTDSINLQYDESVANHDDWVSLSDTIANAGSGYKVPLPGTICGVSMSCTDVKRDATEILLYINGTAITPATINVDKSDTSFVDQTLNHDFSAGDNLRVRMGSTPPGLSVKNLSVVLTVRWRWA